MNLKNYPNILSGRNIFLALILFTIRSGAQIIPEGSFVASRITYLTDDELPDDNLIKYTYLKYTFSNPDKINISSVYYENGRPFLFTIKGDRLIIKSEVGSIMNTLKIMEASENKLIIINPGASGAFDDPKAIKYTLYDEKFIQQKLPLTPDDIFSIRGSDTIYKSGQKVYAKFKGPSFQSFMYEHFRKQGIETKDAELLSTFIISENGKPDSLKIIQGINPKYDAEYKKGFYSSRGMWIPATHNGKNVKVLMNQSLKYSSSEKEMPAYFATQKANAAYNDKDYELALYYYDKSLETKPDEIENLYRRGMCKQILGNLKGACTDWMRIKSLNGKIADELLQKFCK